MRRDPQVPEPEIALTIDSRIEHAALVGVAVRRLGEHLGMGTRAARRLELCAVEAVSNSIRHAYGDMPGRAVTVRLVAYADRVELRVVDDGVPIPRELQRPPPLDPDPARPDQIPESGHGLRLIHAIMDRVEFVAEGGRNVLLMVKARSSDG